MQLDPYIHLWMVEQDRERGMAQRALERAARTGGEQRPGLVRGGINNIVRVLRGAPASAPFQVGGRTAGQTG